MNLWRKQISRTGAYIEIDRDMLTKTLEREFGEELNKAAMKGMMAARAALPHPRMQQTVSMKAWYNTPTGVVDWPTRSMRLPSLMRGMRIPVALVTVNSDWGATWEYGQLQPTKYDRSEFTQHRRMWGQQYRPMAAAAAAVGGFVTGRDPRRGGKGVYR